VVTAGRADEPGVFITVEYRQRAEEFGDHQVSVEATMLDGLYTIPPPRGAWIRSVEAEDDDARAGPIGDIEGLVVSIGPNQGSACGTRRAGRRAARPFSV
jgi:hypothetical protein